MTEDLRDPFADVRRRHEARRRKVIQRFADRQAETREAFCASDLVDFYAQKGESEAAGPNRHLAAQVAIIRALRDGAFGQVRFLSPALIRSRLCTTEFIRGVLEVDPPQARLSCIWIQAENWRQWYGAFGASAILMHKSKQQRTKSRDDDIVRAIQKLGPDMVFSGLKKDRDRRINDVLQRIFKVTPVDSKTLQRFFKRHAAK